MGFVRTRRDRAVWYGYILRLASAQVAGNEIELRK